MNHRKEDDKMNETKEYTEKVFEDIKHIDDEGNDISCNRYYYC